jgi:hypothetical protein
MTKKYGILILFLLFLELYSFKANLILPDVEYNIYYTYTVPVEVLSIIQTAMDEVSPRQYINSSTVLVLGTIEADPINSINNPDTLTQTDEFSLPDEYKDNGRINIHWGKVEGTAYGTNDPNLHPPDIVIDSTKYVDDNIDLATILKHEILHSIGMSHTTATFDGTTASSKIMYYGISPGGAEKFMSQDEINGLNELYNRHYLTPPTPAQINNDPINVLIKDSIKFMAKRDITITNLLNVNNRLLYPYDIDYKWAGIFADSINMRSDSVLYKFYSGTELGTKQMDTFIEGDENQTDKLNRNRVFELFAPNLYTPKADTSIVAEIGNHIPVKLKIKDELDQFYEFSNLYNSDSLKVKYKLWYDGWLSNDTISTTTEIDPNVEFMWYFSSDGADNTININHPDFKIKGGYKITAWLYNKETTTGLSFIDKVDSDEFRISPIVTILKTDPQKADYYALDSLHVFEATCTDANWNDYPYMESMKFYYKKDGETGYTEIPEPPIKTTYYTRSWNSGTYTGEVLIKATASYYSDATLTQLFETSDSITVNIFDGQTCVITNPKPAAEESWDFEFAPYIYSGYYSDHSLESEAVFKTTLQDVKSGSMIFNGTSWNGPYFEWSTCPQTKYHWGYIGFENHWGYYVTNGNTGELNGYEGWHNTYPFWDTIGPTKKDKAVENNTVFFESKREPQPVVESEVGNSKLVSYYDKGYLAYYNDYEHLYPGMYNAQFHAYDINDGVTDIANPASVDFLMPEWKLKLLNESKWLDYAYNSTTGPIYVDRTEYKSGENIHFMIWRPFEYYTRNNLNYKITNSESGTTVFEKNLLSSDYLTDTFITDNYAPEDTLAYYHHILNTSSLEPGFYKIKAEGISLIDSINIIQEKEIQICPFYEQWENGGLWSSDWPAPTGTDTLYWKIKNMGYNYYTANQFLLETHYETGFHLNETHSEDVCTVDNKYPAMLEISIAPRQLWDRDGDFWYWEEQYSKFTIELSKGGADYVIVKTLDLQKDGYLDYPWNPPANPELSNPGDTEDTQYSMLCLSNFSFPIGELTGSGQELKIRLGIEGMPEHFTDNTADNKETLIYVDEIKLWYMKGRLNRPQPRNLAAVQAKESNTVTLSFDPPAVTGSIYPEKYLIYRDGKIISETTGTTFTDTEIKGSTVYNYVVVADYPGYDFYQSSMLDCSIKYQTAPITYARPSYFTLSKGVGLLDNCVTLDWLEPDPNVLRYEIYRNSVLIGTTTELSYEDNLVPDGTYEYYAKARYGEEPYQVSDATLIKSVSIYSTVLPIYEDFEHIGNLPICWDNDVTPHGTDNIWAAGQTVNGIAPYEGSYDAFVSGESSRYICACTERTGLRTPNIDLTSYNNITLSYKINLYHKKYDRYKTTALSVSLFDNSVTESSYCSIDKVNYEHSKRYYLINTNITQQTNGDWQSISLPIDSNFVDCYFVFQGLIYYTDIYDTTYISPVEASVLLDAVSITGTIDLGTPTNVTILRDSANTTLSWDFVPGATEYKVYASEDPYGTFTQDTTGTWISDTEWQKADPGDKYFYYIIAASATKEILKDNRKIKLESEKSPRR